MVAVLGEKLFELVVLTLAFAPLLPQEFAGLVELPHADPNNAATATTPIIARIRLLQGDETGLGREPPALSFVKTAPCGTTSHWRRLEKQVPSLRSGQAFARARSALAQDDN